MARYYTTEQAYKKLAISAATFNKWVTKAKQEGLEEKIAVQPGVDSRNHLYSLAQLRWLAARHGRELLTDEEVFTYDPQLETAIHERALATLEKQVAQLESTLQPLFHRFSELEQQVDRLEKKLNTLHIQTSQKLKNTTKENGDGQSPPNTQLEAPPPLLKEKERTSPHQLHVDKEQFTLRFQKARTRVPDDLPEGTLTMRAFADFHGTTRDMLTPILSRHDVESIARPFGGDPSKTQYFLTPAQQSQILLYLENHHFSYHMCPLCPHTAS